MLLNLAIDYINNHIGPVEIHSSWFTVNWIIGIAFGAILFRFKLLAFLEATGRIKRKRKRKISPKRKTMSDIINQPTWVDFIVSLPLVFVSVLFGIPGVIAAIFILIWADLTD